MINKQLRQTRRYLLSIRKWKMRLAFWSSAVLIGLAAAGFAMLSTRADHFYHNLYHDSPWLALILTPVGLALIAFVTRRFFPGSEGSGIPQAIAAISIKERHLRARILSIRIAIAKIFLTCGGLFCGASIGREGPTVHIGAAIMYSFRHAFPMRGKQTFRAMILAGGAAGIAAAFNTPLAGILFAIEEMSRSYEHRTSGTLLITVVIAGLTALSILGNYTYFGSTDVTLPGGTAWLAVLVCGVAGGLLGGGFSSLLIFGQRRLMPLLLAKPVQVAFGCGLLLSFIGWLSGGQTYGTGYEEAKLMVMGNVNSEDINTSFPFLKLIATTVSYWSGIPGGIFAPSLSIGAGLGADFAQWLPAIPLSAWVILGMAGYFTGVVQTPITALVIIMEMTNHPSMLLPVMATALIATAVSRQVRPKPIYQSLAETFMANLYRAEADKKAKA